MQPAASLRTAFPRATPIDVEQQKRDAYHGLNILVVAIDNPQLTWHERETLRSLGKRLYGERRA